MTSSSFQQEEQDITNTITIDLYQNPLPDLFLPSSPYPQQEEEQDRLAANSIVGEQHQQQQKKECGCYCCVVCSSWTHLLFPNILEDFCSCAKIAHEDEEKTAEKLVCAYMVRHSSQMTEWKVDDWRQWFISLVEQMNSAVLAEQKYSLFLAVSTFVHNDSILLPLTLWSCPVSLFVYLVKQLSAPDVMRYRCRIVGLDCTLFHLFSLSVAYKCTASCNDLYQDRMDGENIRAWHTILSTVGMNFSL